VLVIAWVARTWLRVGGYARSWFFARAEAECGGVVFRHGFHVPDRGAAARDRYCRGRCWKGGGGGGYCVLVMRGWLFARAEAECGGVCAGVVASSTRGVVPAVLAACAVCRYGLLARGSIWECGKREALPCRAPAGSQFTSGK